MCVGSRGACRLVCRSVCSGVACCHEGNAHMMCQLAWRVSSCLMALSISACPPLLRVLEPTCSVHRHCFDTPTLSAHTRTLIVPTCELARPARRHSHTSPVGVSLHGHFGDSWTICIAFSRACPILRSGLNLRGSDDLDPNISELISLVFFFRFSFDYLILLNLLPEFVVCGPYCTRFASLTSNCVIPSLNWLCLSAQFMEEVGQSAGARDVGPRDEPGSCDVCRLVRCVCWIG